MLLMHYEPELRGYYQFCELFKEQYSVSLIEKDKDRIDWIESQSLYNKDLVNSYIRVLHN